MVTAMSTPEQSIQSPSRSIRRGIPVLLIAAALGLSGCGGGTDAAIETETEASGSSKKRATKSDPGDVDDVKVDAPDPVATLPFTFDVPAGQRMGVATCDDPDTAGGDGNDDDEHTYTTGITYAVPEAWKTVGRSSGGSGGVTGTNETLTFQVGESSRETLKVTVGWDTRDLDGKPTDSSGEPWTTFDYDVTVGDKSSKITFDKVGTVQIGDQQAELYYLDPTQAPDLVQGAEYRIRIEAFQLPRMVPDGSFKLMPESFVATLSFDPETVSISQDDIERILKSFVLPECSWDKILLDNELMLHLDLNGDGHIRNAEDLQREIKEMQEKALRKSTKD